jgi:hypothetical protein
LNEKTAGREPLILVQIDQDRCNLEYGVAPCTAASPQNKCFNTLRTCQDPDNFDKGVLTLTFAQPRSNLPRGVNIIPSLVSVTTAPTLINPTNAQRSAAPLGQRAVCTITFQDHPHSDLLVDPYVSERSYDPLIKSTFWAKWLVRNRYYQNRPVRVYEGYVGQDLQDMRVRNYFIDAIQGPDTNGRVQLIAKDPIKLADRQKAQVPPASQGRLFAQISDTATQLDIKDAILTDYAESGTVRIGDELIDYTTRALVEIGSVDYVRLSGLARGSDGSVAEQHNVDANVQQCVRYTDEPVWEVIYDLLTTYAGIPTQFIDKNAWDAEGNTWLVGFELTAVLSRPQGVADILNELFEQVLAYIWWDERDQEIKFRAIRPILGGAPLITDDANIIEDSVSITTDPKNRVSQVWVYWGQRNLALPLDNEGNYDKLRIRADLEAESAEQFGESRIRKIYARWIQNDAQAINLSARLLGASVLNPKVLKLRLDAKDRALWTADIVDVLHRNIVNFRGDKIAERYQVLSVEEVEPGETVEYVLNRFIFRGTRFGFYMEEAALDFEQYTLEQLEAGQFGFYSEEDGRMSDGSLGWEYQ